MSREKTCGNRPAIRRDMPEVLAIEDASFKDPWVEADFIKALRQRNIIGIVVEGEDQQIVGFAIYELHKTFLEIINLAVHREHRRSGVGRQIVDKLKSKLSANRRASIIAHVSEDNLNGQLFFKAAGFSAQMVVRNFYPDGQDAYLFRHHFAQRGQLVVADDLKVGQPYCVDWRGAIIRGVFCGFLNTKRGQPLTLRFSNGDGEHHIPAPHVQGLFKA